MVVPTLGLLYVPEAEVLLTVSLTTVVAQKDKSPKKTLHYFLLPKLGSTSGLSTQDPPLSANGTEFAAAPILPADGNKTVVPEGTMLSDRCRITYKAFSLGDPMFSFFRFELRKLALEWPASWRKIDLFPVVVQQTA